LVGRARFENQRGFHDGDGVWVPASRFFHPLFLAARRSPASRVR
jgi:hypothetical protein